MAPIEISVIIPILNAAKYLPNLIEKLRAQEQEIAEIMVVDSGSLDQSAALAEELDTRLVAIEAGSFDHGATRNLAATLATGNILVFMTQDALPACEKTIGELVSPLLQERIAVSYARQVSGKDASLSDRYLRLTNYPPQGLLKTRGSIPELGIKTFQNSNVCAAYRRKEFEELGRFPEPAVCNEDMIFAARAIFAGYGVYYNADALVFHNHNFSVSQLFRRYFDIGASLELEPRIREVGKAETKGLEFLIGQVNFLQGQQKYAAIPSAYCEAVAKFCGYKMGTIHRVLPKKLKKYLGANNNYWERVKENKV